MSGDSKNTVKEVRKSLERERKEKENDWTGTKVFLLVLIIIMLAISTLFGVLLLLPDDQEPVGAVLEVEEVYFVAKEADGDDIELEIFGFLTNDGDEPCEARIRAFAIDVQTNLAMDDTTAEVGEIVEQTTKEASLTVDLPRDGRYRVELLIFKDGKVSVKGQGTVNLAETGSGGQDYSTNTYDEPPAEKENATPSIFNALGVIVAVSLCILLVKRRWR